MEKEKAAKLVTEAKAAANNGELQKSLKLFEDAYQIFPSEKLKKRILKLEVFIENLSSESEEEDEDMIDLGKQFYLHKSIATNLYEYQKKGVLWFWELHKKREGGILGDDMGLGKTIQVIAFLAGMFDADLIKHVLVVAPLSILVNWEKEIGKWAGGIRIKPFHGSSKKQRVKNLYKIQEKEGILITTYGMVVSNTEVLCTDHNGDKFVWDYIILDEGHKIKNPTKTSKCIRQVPAKYHYILTGTPIQNNLNELWALFDFTQQGELLGTRKTFDMEFQKPIVRAREKDASEYQQQVGNKIAESLRNLIAPYFLRRTKSEIFNRNKKNKDLDSIDHNSDQNVRKEVKEHRIPELKTRKDDLIIWVYLSELQLKLYQGFIVSERVKQCLVTTRSPLAELNLLKKISDHPRLQSTLSKLLSSTEEEETRMACGIEVGEQDTSDETMHQSAEAPPVQKLIEDSGKMVFLVQLMDNLRKEHHRTIIFSQSRKMLDIIQKVLKSMDHKLLRIDGTINNPLDRDKIVQLFQNDRSYTTMLMTIQVGSVGLTLTGADRLVIFDPSWNPGTDAQAVDRVYRVGQTKDVVIYRLITCGSIEEKIYRKQIFKNSVMKQATGASNNPYRYFTNQDLRELFVLDDPKESRTQMQLEDMHQHHDNTDGEFEKHLQILKNNDSVFGVSHHDQLFSQEATNSENNEFSELIEKQVNQAEQRITEEFNNIDFSPKRTQRISESSRINPRVSEPSKEPSSQSLEFSMSTLNIGEDETVGTNISQSSIIDVSESQASIIALTQSQASVIDVSQSQASVIDVSQSQASVIALTQSQASVIDVSKSQASVIDVSQSQASVIALSQSQASVIDLNQSQTLITKNYTETTVDLNQPYATARDTSQPNARNNTQSDVSVNNSKFNSQSTRSNVSMNNKKIDTQSSNTINDSNHASNFINELEMSTTEISTTGSQETNQTKPLTETEVDSLYHSAAMNDGNNDEHLEEFVNEDDQGGRLIVISSNLESAPIFGTSTEHVDPKSAHGHSLTPQATASEFPDANIRLSYEAVDMGCGLLDLSSVSEKHNSALENYSVVEVVDMACSPCGLQSGPCKLHHLENVNTKDDDSFQERKEVTSMTDNECCGSNSESIIEKSKEIYHETDNACSPLRHSHSQMESESQEMLQNSIHNSACSEHQTSHASLRNMSSGKADDDYPENQCQEMSTNLMGGTSRIVNTPNQVIRELGRLYRTPPISPFVLESGRKKHVSYSNQQQNTSTPIDKKKATRRIINQSDVEQDSILEINPVHSNVVESSDNSVINDAVESPANIVDSNTTHSSFNESVYEGSDSLQISLRASEDTDDSIYDAKDVTCSPIKNLNKDHPPLQQDDTNNSEYTGFKSGNSTQNVSEDFENSRNLKGNICNNHERSREISQHDISDCDIHNTVNDVDVSVFRSESTGSVTNCSSAGAMIDVGESPTSTTNRRRTMAETFFNETVESLSSLSSSENDGLLDTQPIDPGTYGLNAEEEESKEEISIKDDEKSQLMQSATQESTVNTSQESVFDLDRLEKAKKEKENDEEECMVIEESFEVSDFKGLDCEENAVIDEVSELKGLDCEENAVIDDSMEDEKEVQDETESFDVNTEDEHEEITNTRSPVEIETRRLELMELKSLMLSNMGNKEIGEKLFVKIVGKIEELKIFDML